MTVFIKVTILHNDELIVINVDSIQSLTKCHQNATNVTFKTGKSVVVKESIDKILILHTNQL